MPSEGSRLARHAFHQVAVSANGVHVEIENVETRAVVIFPEPFAGNRHAHAVSRALSQRTGRGFDAGGEMRFGMSRRAAINLAEALDLLHGNRETVRDFTVLIDRAHTR